VSWAVSAASVVAAAWLLPGIELLESGSGFLVALAVAVFNAILPPVLAALRLPFVVALGFLLALFANALLLVLAADVLPDAIDVSSFGDALLAALVMAAVSLTLEVLLGTDDDDEYGCAWSAASRGARASRSAPRCRASCSSRSTGSRCRAARRDARRQRADDGELDRRRRLPPDRMGDRPLLADRRQPGRHPARLQRGHPRLPLGREGDRARDQLLLPCRLRGDRARRATGDGLLVDGGASRGNLLSGEAEETILTVSRTDAEKRANPATARSSPTASTSRGRSCCSSSRSCSR
jgi:putative membrane protein